MLDEEGAMPEDESTPIEGAQHEGTERTQPGGPQTEAAGPNVAYGPATELKSADVGHAAMGSRQPNQQPAEPKVSAPVDSPHPPPASSTQTSFRGPLRYEVETSSSSLVAGTMFSLYVRILNKRNSLSDCWMTSARLRAYGSLSAPKRDSFPFRVPPSSPRPI